MAKQWKQIWLGLSQTDFDIELQQAKEEGKDVSSIEGLYKQLKGMDVDDDATQALGWEFLDRSAALPIVPGYKYVEPSDLAGIKAARPAPVALPRRKLAASEIAEKVHGAWLGRVCGCLLGKPVEGWRRPKMWGYLKATNRWPLADYFAKPSPEMAKQFDIWPDACFAETVKAMPEDDDTNYTTTGLMIVKKNGKDFTPEDVASFWLGNLPIFHLCTAERIAYKNLANLIGPPQSGSYRNCYREWIGAQIRADFFGYAAPGNPELAADFAWRDASISHVKNGIYGEMWVAAMLAAAYVTNDLNTVILAGLAQVPAKCRLAEDVLKVMAWHKGGMSYDDAVEAIHKQWDEVKAHDWCHTISNAMIVAAGLLWGELDYGRSICRAVQPCFDTDCNGATVGSIVGMILGASKLPAKWTEAVHDTMHTGLVGYHTIKISDMARESAEIIAKVNA